MYVHPDLIQVSKAKTGDFFKTADGMIVIYTGTSMNNPYGDNMLAQGDIASFTVVKATEYEPCMLGYQYDVALYREPDLERAKFTPVKIEILEKG